MSDYPPDPYGYDGFNGCQDGGGRGLYGPITPCTMIPKEQNITMLEYQAKILEQAVEQIKKRLKELKKEE